MHPALLGCLVGLGAGAFFIISEYLLLNKQAEERAKRVGSKRPKYDDVERKRLRSVIGFSCFLPPVLALGFWVVLPKLGL